MKKRDLKIYAITSVVIAIISCTSSLCYVSADDYAYKYKAEYSKWQTKWTPYKPAGNQCPEGYQFRQGKGSFQWSEGGKEAVSVGFTPPGKFGYFSVSVPLGKRSSQGLTVEITDKPSYAKKHMYKLYVKRKVRARQVKTYRKRRDKKGAKWKCYCTTNQKEILSVSLDARSVGKFK